MVSIISDGQENSSVDWTSERLAEKIQQLQDTGRWTFSYVGANVDLSKVQQQTGIHISNIMSYTSDAAGTKAAFANRAASVGAYTASTRMRTESYWTNTDETKRT